MEYLFQRIIQNHFQWTRPSPGRLGASGEGEYVQENGFGHEDWNFNKNLLIERSIYGYCYYRPSEQKRGEPFSIAFATYTNKQWYLVGFYLNCEFVDEPPVQRRVLDKKMKDLKQLGNSLGGSWLRLSDKKFVEKLEDEAQSLKWRVSPDNAVRMAQPIAIPSEMFNTRNYRIVKPTSIDATVFQSLYDLAQSDMSDEDYGDESEFPEGRELERKHRSRERNQAAIRAAKDAFVKKHGKLFCQVCGFDFQDKYGEAGRGFIEGHHTIPISDLAGEVKTKARDIALVCANCHRMLHRKRPWFKMKDLKRLVDKNA